MGRHSCSSSSSSSSLKPKLRKGLWSPEEDEKLYNYITRFGVGCWSSVPKDAGLQRCGKSCRLRWINYLRPDLKRGMFSQEEEDLIIRLHEILGNRWAQIAAQLPGRTDNEIKNFWNSCLKKKLMKQGIDPSTHKPLPEEKEASDHENNVIEMPTTSNLLPNNNNSSYYNEVLMTEWSAIESKPLFNPLLPFLGYPEESNPMQYNSDHFVQYHPPLKQGFDEKIFESSSTICGFPSSMPRLTSFDQGSFNENDFSNSSAVLSDAKESSCNSSNISCSYNGFQGIKIEHPAAGPIWDGPENKMDSLLFQGMNEIKSEEGNLNSWQENHLHAQNADDFRSYTLFSDDDFNHI